MNYLYTLLTAFFFLQTLNAQRFFVEEFRYDPSDISAIRYERSDVNDLKCAIIKVRSNIEGLHFDSNLGITHLEARTGEVWLYVSPGERGLKFMRQGYITMDYNIPIRIESSRVYILELLATTVDDNGISEIESQWLIITSQPEGADIYINNEPAGRTPYQNELPAGEYSWRVTSSLYLPEEGIVTLQPGDGNREQFHIELTPNYGTLVIRSSPENGASVSLNGINMNLTTPATLERVPAGNNTITLSLNDYETTSESIQLSAGEHRNLDISMRPTFATVMVETEPPSVIFINDQNRGSSIWEGRLTPGVYTFEARLDRHRPATERQQIISGEQYMVRLNPEPITGSLRIISMPIGAQIRIEGRDYGTTPVTIRDLIIGEYNVEISHTGHASIIEQVNITEGGTSEINTTLPAGMQVTITSEPAGAELYIDNNLVGRTPFTGELSFGNHRLKLVNQSKTVEETIAIKQGGQNRFSFNVVIFPCGDNITFRYRGRRVTYGTVEGQNGTCWMDRNLGASRVARSYNDRRAYGDLFQWGRGDDGHQLRNSNTSSARSHSDNLGHSSFITHTTSYDWRSPQNDNLWQGDGGINDVCPAGWRLPTETELNNERLSWSSNDRAGAYASSLKFIAGGQRTNNGSLSNVGSKGYYWSSSVSGSYARYLDFSSSYARMYSYYRVYGRSVRCTRDD